MNDTQFQSMLNRGLVKGLPMFQVAVPTEEAIDTYDAGQLPNGTVLFFVVDGGGVFPKRFNALTGEFIDYTLENVSDEPPVGQPSVRLDGEWVNGQALQGLFVGLGGSDVAIVIGSSYRLSGVDNIFIANPASIVALELSSESVTKINQYLMPFVSTLSLTAPALTSFDFGRHPELYDLTIDNLTISGTLDLSLNSNLNNTLTIQSTSYESVLLPICAVRDLIMDANAQLAGTLDISTLTSLLNLTITTTPLLTALFYPPSLATITLYQLDALTSLGDLTGLSSLYTLSCGSCPLTVMPDLSLCALLINVDITNAAVTDPASIDQMFIDIDAATSPNAVTIDISGGTTAAPTATSATARANIISNGGTIITN